MHQLPPSPLCSGGAEAAAQGDGDGAVPASKLNIIDFVLFNQLASLPNVTVTQQQLKEWFPGAWVLALRSVASPAQPQFDHYYNTESKTSVVVVDTAPLPRLSVTPMSL